MKKVKARHTSFYDPVFRFELIVLYGMEKEKAKRILARKYKVRKSATFIDHDNYEGLTIKCDDGSCVIYFPDKKPSLYAIVHEVEHAVIKGLLHRGVKLRENSSEETYCYWAGYWAEKVYDFIFKGKTNTK